MILTIMVMEHVLNRGLYKQGAGDLEVVENAPGKLLTAETSTQRSHDVARHGA